MDAREDVAGLVEEYRTLFGESETSTPDSIKRVLIKQADWTPEAASHLIELARAYGSFMLRNALAISLALDWEDGDLGF
jgi:hypothetical protein